MSHVDAYMFPCPSKDAATQVADLVSFLDGHGTKYGQVSNTDAESCFRLLSQTASPPRHVATMRALPIHCRSGWTSRRIRARVAAGPLQSIWSPVATTTRPLRATAITSARSLLPSKEKERSLALTRVRDLCVSCIRVWLSVLGRIWRCTLSVTACRRVHVGPSSWLRLHQC
jgi:hypothetical protein